MPALPEKWVPVPLTRIQVCILVRKILTATLRGIHALPVTIEVDSSLGLPGFSMVGLPDSAVREARERVVSAIRSSGFAAMNHRITVNLAPADLRKEGSAFDLALAMGILVATEQLDVPDADSIMILGELSLDGSVQSIRGVLSFALGARALGKKLWCPKRILRKPWRWRGFLFLE